MTIASAYTIDEIVKELDRAYSAFLDGDRAGYEKELASTLKSLEELAKKYPKDEEMKNYLRAFSSFYEERKTMRREDEKAKLSELISDIKHKVHWRKVETAAAKDLPFKDFRSLRGEAPRR